MNGFAHVLVFLSALEFILAQAPRTMQSFLIGLWHAMQSVNFAITIAAYLLCVLFEWQYYASKTLLACLSVLLFVAVTRKYKYRKLNEEADVNLRQEVEDVFERNFDRRLEYEQQIERDLREILQRCS